MEVADGAWRCVVVTDGLRRFMVVQIVPGGVWWWLMVCEGVWWGLMVPGGL